jgi:phosphoribosylglycinamide formyltransferase-1
MLFIFNFYSFFCVTLNGLAMKKILIFASGSGTNAENVIKYFQENKNGVVVCVFTNNPNAKVIDRAKNYGVPSCIFTKEELIESKIIQKIKNLEPDLIVLAGFLLKFPANIIAAYPNKIINIHPALLPNYGGKGMYGMHIHKAVVENKEEETGITIHYVNENYDEGTIIFQKSVALSAIDTPESVAIKIHTLEQTYFPEIIEKVLNANH